MATSIPPHNMSELMDAAQLIINKTIQGEETDVNDLMQCIKGPDFPDGGIMIANNKELKKASPLSKYLVSILAYTGKNVLFAIYCD